MSRIAQKEEEDRLLLEKDRRRLKFHLMPPTGWLNDPNGLCEKDGVYHVFFQYSPFDANGGEKFWGQYTSRDLVHWRYQGACLVTDEAFDRDGVYSGCSFVEEDRMYLFYTGNVKYEGNYDYIQKGREANVVLVESPDGVRFGEKQLLLTNEDYPTDYTLHVRDPKVFERNGSYKMVLGGRKRDGRGAVLVYQSADLKSWHFQTELTLLQEFGYMWECPDLFELGKEWYLSVSPQGLAHREYEFQNVYTSGYFRINGDFERGGRPERFIEWDKGFDFYAPQTFLDEQGRRILIGWAGMPDAEYENPTAADGWQHALTVPREITCRDGILYQYPVRELERLRGSKTELLPTARQSETAGTPGTAAASQRAESAETPDTVAASQQPGKMPAAGDSAAASCLLPPAWDLELELAEESSWFKISLTDVLDFTWNGREAILAFCQPDSGCGRSVRKAQIASVREVRVLGDTSLLEIYVNRGELVFTTRCYPEQEDVHLSLEGAFQRVQLWEMQQMEVKY